MGSGFGNCFCLFGYHYAHYPLYYVLNVPQLSVTYHSTHMNALVPVLQHTVQVTSH